MCAQSLSHVRLFATLWTVAHQAPLSMGFSRQEYWSELPCPPPGDLPNPGIESRSSTLQADSLLSEPPGKLPNVVVPVFTSIYILSFYWAYEKKMELGSLHACILSCFSHVRLFTTLRTVTCQAPLSMGFYRQTTEVGCHALLQGIFPAQGQVGSLPVAPPAKP